MTWGYSEIINHNNPLTEKWLTNGKYTNKGDFIMTKKKAIILIIAAVALVGIAVVVYNFVFNGSKSVGINSSITNEDGKNPKVDTKNQKILVVYFSETGNTQALAKIISDQVGGDFRRIETVKAYPSGNALYDYAKKERDDDARPELKDLGVKSGRL